MPPLLKTHHHHVDIAVSVDVVSDAILRGGTTDEESSDAAQSSLIAKQSANGNGSVGHDHVDDDDDLSSMIVLTGRRVRRQVITTVVDEETSDDDDDDDVSSNQLSSRHRSPPVVSDGDASDNDTETDDDDMSSVDLKNDNNEASPAAKSPAKRRRRHASVSFAPQVQVRPISTRSNVPQSVMREIWYSTSELRSIRQSAVQTVVKFNRQRLLDSALAIPLEKSIIDGTMYGLEPLLRPNNQRRKLMRANVVETVQMQQQLERISGRDAEWMGMLCRNMTSESQRRAHKAAVAHQQHVESLWREEERR